MWSIVQLKKCSHCQWIPQSLYNLYCECSLTAGIHCPQVQRGSGILALVFSTWMLFGTHLSSSSPVWPRFLELYEPLCDRSTCVAWNEWKLQSQYNESEVWENIEIIFSKAKVIFVLRIEHRWLSDELFLTWIIITSEIIIRWKKVIFCTYFLSLNNSQVSRNPY